MGETEIEQTIPNKCTKRKECVKRMNCETKPKLRERRKQNYTFN